MFMFFLYSNQLSIWYSVIPLSNTVMCDWLGDDGNNTTSNSKDNTLGTKKR